MTRFKRFELSGPLGDYFEIAIEPTKITSRTGRGLSRGRDLVRKCNSIEEARSFAVQLIEAHLLRGYVPADAPPPPLPPLPSEVRALEKAAAEVAPAPSTFEASNPALEAQCAAASSEDPTNWSVYADWLIEQNDLRGTIAALHLSGKTNEAHQLFEGARTALCNATGVTISPIEVTFRHGFVDGITVGRGWEDRTEPLAETVERLLAAPIGAFVEAIRCGLHDFGGTNTWRPTLDAIAKSRRAGAIRELRFDAYEYDDCMIHWVQCGDFSGLERFPRLEVLHVRGSEITWGDLSKLPPLKKLVRETANLHHEELAQLLAAAWPALHHLDLWFGNQDYGCNVEPAHLAPIFDGSAMPKLTHLGIMNCDRVDAFIEALATSPLLPRLESLDLSMGTLGDPEPLIRHAPAFRHLASIDLDENMLLEADEERLAAVLDNVSFGSQREPPEEEDDLRYVAEHE